MEFEWGSRSCSGGPRWPARRSRPADPRSGMVPKASRRRRGSRRSAAHRPRRRDARRPRRPRPCGAAAAHRLERLLDRPLDHGIGREVGRGLADGLGRQGERDCRGQELGEGAVEDLPDELAMRGAGPGAHAGAEDAARSGEDGEPGVDHGSPLGRGQDEAPAVAQGRKRPPHAPDPYRQAGGLASVGAARTVGEPPRTEPRAGPEVGGAPGGGAGIRPWEHGRGEGVERRDEIAPHGVGKVKAPSSATALYTSEYEPSGHGRKPTDTETVSVGPWAVL